MKMLSVRDVSKTFSHVGHLLLRDRLAAMFGSARQRDPFYALKRISFDVAEGESIAIIGTNGSGKSTLLGLLAGLALPDTGTVDVQGRVAALLDLGSGFHYDLTGAENLRLNASILGLTRKRTVDLYDSIVEFSELGDFIEQPLRTYSTGMVLRLAFSVAMHVDPDILIIDEVLGVGDHTFQVKCFEKMLGFRRAGHTLIVVSHSGPTLRQICSRAIWLDHGSLVDDGEINTVLDLYEQGRTPSQIRNVPKE